MKAKTIQFLTVLMFILSACAVPTKSSNQSSSGDLQPAPAKSQEKSSTSTSAVQPAQAWSNAPLSTGILFSRFDSKGNNEIYVMDPQSGLPVASARPIFMGKSFVNIRSLDGKTLAAIAYPNSESSSNGKLHLVDLAKWEDTTLDFDIDEWTGVLALSPDGRYLAITTWKSGTGIYLVDLVSRELVGQTELKNKFATLQFTHDSSGLMVYMNRWDSTRDPEIPPQGALISIPGLEIRWSRDLSEVKDGFFATDSSKDPHEPGAGITLSPGVAFSLIEDKAFIVHADEDVLTTVDFNSQSVNTVEIAPQMSWLERLLWQDAQPVKAKMLEGTVKKAIVSPDGKALYVTGITNHYTQLKNNELELNTVPFGLQVIDARSGTELTHYVTTANTMRFSPDGRWLFLYGYDAKGDYGIPWTQVFDPRTQEPKTTLDETQLYPAYRLNGQLVYVSEFSQPNQRQQLRIYDSDFTEILTLENDPKHYLTWLVGPVN